MKLKWKKLRDSYRDALKRQSEMLAKDPANPAKKNYPWKYMGLMQFLQPYMSNRKKPTGSPSYPAPQQPAENGHAEHSSSDSESDAESAPKRKNCSQLTVIDRKLDYLCKAQSAKRACASPAAAAPAPAAAAAAAHPDPLDIFFNSMCQSTKRFPFPTQIKVHAFIVNLF